MSAFYATDRALAEYLLFHYGTPELALPWAMGPREALEFPRRCVEECLVPETLATSAARDRRGLDLGCAVGRGTFALARHCGEVIGIDFSAKFIGAAQRLLELGHLDFPVVMEGDRTVNARATRPELPDFTRITFEVGDALALRPDLGGFDVVLAANLLDRVREPGRLLRSLPGLLRPGGQLILTSPYTWLEEYTPREAWLVDPQGRATWERLAEELAGLRLVRRLDLPFLLREHARKFQWSVAEATVWQRDG